MPRISGRNPATPRRSAREAGAARFELAGSLKTGMAEASDVAALPGGRFIVVGDKKDSAAIVGAVVLARRRDPDPVTGEERGATAPVRQVTP